MSKVRPWAFISVHGFSRVFLALRLGSWQLSRCRQIRGCTGGLWRSAFNTCEPLQSLEALQIPPPKMILNHDYTMIIMIEPKIWGVRHVLLPGHGTLGLQRRGQQHLPSARWGSIERPVKPQHFIQDCTIVRTLLYLLEMHGNTPQYSTFFNYILHQYCLPFRLVRLSHVCMIQIGTACTCAPGHKDTHPHTYALTHVCIW